MALCNSQDIENKFWYQLQKDILNLDIQTSWARCESYRDSLSLGRTKWTNSAASCYEETGFFFLALLLPFPLKHHVTLKIL